MKRGNEFILKHAGSRYSFSLQQLTLHPGKQLKTNNNHLQLNKTRYQLAVIKPRGELKHFKIKFIFLDSFRRNTGSR